MGVVHQGITGHDRWLSVPEQWLLFDPPGWQTMPFLATLTLLEVIARGALRLGNMERRFPLGWTRPVDVLRRGPYDWPDNPVLQVVKRAYHDVPPHIDFAGREWVAVKGLATELVKWGWSRRGHEQEVFMALADRGLFVRESYRLLGVFPASWWQITAEGGRARADLPGRLSNRRGVLL